MSVSDFIKDKYVLCLCEGNAEPDIMDMLLENEMLIISKNDLIERKFHKRESVRAIEEKHLGLHYEKAVVIFKSY